MAFRFFPEVKITCAISARLSQALSDSDKIHCRLVVPHWTKRGAAGKMKQGVHSMSFATEPAKAAAKAVLDSLPDDATWEDVQYHLYVRQQIAAGLEDEAAGRLIDTDEMRRRLMDHKAQRGRGTT